jgi:hypothetical protein
MNFSCLRILGLSLVLSLTGCAANQLHGYEHVYQGYNVPQPLLDTIQAKLKQNGLAGAHVERDATGRVRLAGQYRNEDEVDRAFLIVQSIVGLKSTSPFYPEQVLEKRWEAEARQALAQQANARLASLPGRKIALVIGISDFRDSRHFKAIPGEDDAAVVAKAASSAKYQVTALLGKRATKAAIEDTLRRLETDLRPNDSLFIYISSHGTPPLPEASGGDARRMSIIAWDSGDAAIDNSTDYYLNLQKTAVPDALVQRLAKKPTKNTRILIDTCYSGEMLKGLPDASGGYIARTNGGMPEMAGIAMASWTGKDYTSKGIHFSEDRSASNARRDGSVAAGPEVYDERAYAIITATSEGEESLAPRHDVGTFTLDGKQLRGSYFTQSFFYFLEKHGGHVEPAFEEARLFTMRNAGIVSGGQRTQRPRQFATKAFDQNNL